jgi:alcohol dehydrogenase class IV
MTSLATVLGGTVIVYKSTGGPHMNSFSWYDVTAHGNATGLMLPYYIPYYAKNPVVAEKLRPIAKMLGVAEGPDIGASVARAMLDWYASFGFPTTLKGFDGFNDAYITKAVADAAQNKMKLEAMPNPMSEADAPRLLDAILRGAYEGDLQRVADL